MKPLPLLAALLLPLPALAQTSTSPSPSDYLPSPNEFAKTFYNQGLEAAQAKDWPTARAAFLNAWKLVQNVQIAANLGWAELELKMYPEAAEHLDFVIKNPPPDLSQDDKKTTQSMFDRARNHIGELSVETNIEGAEILVDQQPAGTTPLNRTLFVGPGSHHIEAHLKDYAPARQSIDIEPGSALKSVILQLQKIDVPTPENRGPNSVVLWTGWAVAGAGVIVTAVSAAFTLSYDSQIGDHYARYNQKCSEYPTGLDACLRDYEKLRQGWALSANTALYAGLLSGAALIGMGTYTFWPWDSPQAAESKRAWTPAMTVQVGKDSGYASMRVYW